MSRNRKSDVFNKATITSLILNIWHIRIKFWASEGLDCGLLGSDIV